MQDNAFVLMDAMTDVFIVGLILIFILSLIELILRLLGINTDTFSFQTSKPKTKKIELKTYRVCHDCDFVFQNEKDVFCYNCGENITNHEVDENDTNMLSDLLEYQIVK